MRRLLEDFAIGATGTAVFTVALPLVAKATFHPIGAWLLLPATLAVAFGTYTWRVRYAWPRLAGNVLFSDGDALTIEVNRPAHTVARGRTVSSVHVELADGSTWRTGEMTHAAARQLAAAITSGTSCRTRPDLGPLFWVVAGVLLLLQAVATVFEPVLGLFPAMLLVGWAYGRTRFDRWGLEQVPEWTEWEVEPDAFRVCWERVPQSARAFKPKVLWLARSALLVLVAYTPTLLLVSHNPLMRMAFGFGAVCFTLLLTAYEPATGHWLQTDERRHITGDVWTLGMSRDAPDDSVVSVTYDEGIAIVWGRWEMRLELAFLLAAFVPIGAVWIAEALGATPGRLDLLGLVGMPMIGGLTFASTTWLLRQLWRDEAVFIVSGRYGDLRLGRQAAGFALEDATFTVQRRKVVMSLRDGRVFHLDALEPERLAAVLREHQGTPVPLTPDEQASAATMARLLQRT